MNRITPENIISLGEKEIFVFGSNLRGRHGKGAALQAVKFGAKEGQGVGFASKTVAIPTKDGSSPLHPLPLDRIEHFVRGFIALAKGTDNYTYYVTALGTGLASYTPEQIAPMFAECVELENVFLPESFWNVLNKR